MTHYRSNVRDIEFNLFEVFNRQEVLKEPLWSDLDEDTIKGMLQAAAELAENELGKTFLDADFGSVDFDPSTGTAKLPQAFHDTYQKYVDAEWWRMDIPTELGGIAVPQSLRWAVAEMSGGANPAAFLYASGWPQAQILYRQGNEAQKKFAQYMVERGWGATMVLTEPDAGSAVGSARTKAIPQADGTWHIEGVKRFITSAEHDLSDNIAHMVLARPVDTPGAGGPGTKGLSLYLVPKFKVDFDTGELGERNGVYVTHIERKMGLKASTTCELTFGENEPAVGWLVGDVHNGIAQMFEIVEYARMLVGTKAMTTLSTAYLNALDYAKTRLQSPDIKNKGDRSAPDIPIIQHPDVRLSLLQQKAYAEGLRVLVTYAATCLDDTELAESLGEDSSAIQARADLLLPIVKGFSSEMAHRLLGDSLQVFGGSGYLQDYPIEQYIRDSKIDTIYEGTTAIQGQDLFFRKIVRDNGAAYSLLMEDIRGFAQSDAGKRSAVAEELLDAADQVDATVAQLRVWAKEAKQQPDQVYKVALCTTRLVYLLGELTTAWLVARQASIAVAALENGDHSDEDVAFYRGKIAIAKFLVRERLPHIAAERKIIAATTLDIMDMADDEF